MPPTKDANQKRILLVDDIWESGSSIKEAAKWLSKYGAKEIAPLVIVKTAKSLD